MINKRCIMNEITMTPSIDTVTFSDKFKVVPPPNCWILLTVNCGKGRFQLHTTISEFKVKDCFLITASEQLHYASGKDTVCEFTLITFERNSLVNTGINMAPLRMLDDYLNSFDSYLLVTLTDEQYQIFNHYINLCLYHKQTQQPYSMLICHHTFFSLLLFAARIYFVQHPEKSLRKTASNRIIMIETIKQYVLDNYANPISLQTIANLVFTNPSYISRIFKEETRVSLSHYINEVRIENVKRLLIDTNDLIEDIATHCGFNYMSHFNQTFKNFTRLTPKEYRKKYKPNIFC